MTRGADGAVWFRMNDHDDLYEREPETPSSGLFWGLLSLAAIWALQFLNMALIGAGIACGALLVYRYLYLP